MIVAFFNLSSIDTCLVSPAVVCKICHRIILNAVWDS